MDLEIKPSVKITLRQPQKKILNDTHKPGHFLERLMACSHMIKLQIVEFFNF